MMLGETVGDHPVEVRGCQVVVCVAWSVNILRWVHQPQLDYITQLIDNMPQKKPPRTHPHPSPHYLTEATTT
jgi:hypothetical protein